MDIYFPAKLLFSNGTSIYVTPKNWLGMDDLGKSVHSTQPFWDLYNTTLQAVFRVLVTNDYLNILVSCTALDGTNTKYDGRLNKTCAKC